MDKKNDSITIDFDKPLEPAQRKSKVWQHGLCGMADTKGQNRTTIDLDNYEPAKEPFLKTRPGISAGLCGLSMSEDERKKQQLMINLDKESKMDKEKEELERVAFAIVKDCGGIDRGEWVSELIRNYPQEVVAVFGDNPFDADGLLADMWDCDNYEDPLSGVSMSWEEWSSFFSVDASITVYNALVELRNNYISLGAELKRLGDTIDGHTVN